MRTRGRFTENWIFVLWATLAVLAMCGGVLAAEGTDLPGIKAGLRATARTSLALFLLAFAASSLRRLWPTPLTGWLLRNRRYVGVSFAVSHFVHLALLARLADLTPERFTGNPAGLIPGALAYLFILLLTLTSFDRTAAWLGRRWWKRLHLAGSWWIWVVFAGNYTSKVTVGPGFALTAAAVYAVAMLRVWAWLRARRHRAAR